MMKAAAARPRSVSPRRWLWLLPVVLVLGGSVLWLAPDPRAQLAAVTGEEALFPQLRGVWQWAWRWTRPLPQTADEVAVAYTDLPPFGVNTFLEQEVEPEKRERSLQLIAAAGFHWIRQPFTWSDIEIHGKGDFEDRRNRPYRSAWDKYDNIVDLAERYQLEIIARLGAAPNWSRADGNARGDFAPPDRLEDFADFAATVVSRYRGRIRFYQIWNEPNIYPEWGKQPVDPEAYTALLCLTYRRIKAVDPEAVVISGALAPTIELGTPNAEGGNNLMDVVFLQRMYNAGARDCFDILAVNDYMLRSGATDRRLRPNEVNFSRPLWVRDVMVANGDAAKPLWISEMNSNAVPAGLPQPFGQVTEEQQARYAVAAYERIQREWPWAGVTCVWFFKRAADTEKDQPFYYFRLLEPDFTPLPVYEALKTYLTTLEPTLYRGRHQENTWQVTYEGEWETVAAPTASLGYYRRALTPGASLTLAWEGRALVLTPGPGSGRIQVRVDNGPAQSVALTGAPVTIGRAREGGRHTLTLIAVEGEVGVDELWVR